MMKYYAYLFFAFFTLFSSSDYKTNRPKADDIVSCAPMPGQRDYLPFGTMVTVKDGAWEDPSTWLGMVVPGPNDNPVIAHTVMITGNVQVHGLSVDPTGILMFNPGISTTLTTDGSIINMGVVERAPVSADIVHLIKFINVNEAAMVGGGNIVLPTDIGFWTMGAGFRYERGTPKTSWTNAVGDVAKGATTLTVKSATGWNVGDRIFITPTAKNDFSSFDTLSIKSISGNTITLSRPIPNAHPSVNNGKWTAEVGNLTRNVRTEGTPGHRSFCFTKSSKPQTIMYSSFRYLGPRKDINGDGKAEIVLGRYGNHDHECKDGSKGTMYEGAVSEDAGNYSFVNHISNGITLTGCIVFNGSQGGFWWDQGFENSSHSIRWENNLVANVGFVRGALKIESSSPTDPTFAAIGYELNFGDDNILKNCVATGVQSADNHTGAAFFWEAVNNSHQEGIWVSDGMLAHNNVTGYSSWQNTVNNHLIKNLNTYRNELAGFHGAYANDYDFEGGEDFENVFEVKAASSNTSRVRFANRKMDSVVLLGSALPGKVPILFRECNIRVLVDAVSESPNVHSVDIINCTGRFLMAPGTVTGETMRIQPKTGQPYKIVNGVQSNIEKFGPSEFANGTGLTLQLYNNSDFTGLILKKLDTYIGKSEWANGVHHLTDQIFSARWTGQVQSYETDTVTFISNSEGGKASLWVNDKFLFTKNKGTDSARVIMTAGVKYNIRFEYSQTDPAARGGANLLWSSKVVKTFTAGGREYVPRCQLFPDPLISLPITEPTRPNRPEVIKNITVQTYAKEAVLVKSPKAYVYEIFTVSGVRIKSGRLTEGVNTIPVPVNYKGIIIIRIDGKQSFKILRE